MCKSIDCFSVFSYISLFVEPLFPLLLESVVVGINRDTSLAYYIILISAIIQIILSLFSGLSVYRSYYSEDGIMAFFSDPLTVKKNCMLPYDVLVFFVLATWIPTNLICTWVNLSYSLPRYIHFVSYLPQATWLISLVIGYYTHQTKPEYVPV